MDRRFTTHRLLRSTSAFLQTKLAYRRPTPLISVKANMIFPPPLTLVLSRRKMCCRREGRRFQYTNCNIDSDMQGEMLERKDNSRQHLIFRLRTIMISSTCPLPCLVFSPDLSRNIWDHPVRRDDRDQNTDSPGIAGGPREERTTSWRRLSTIAVSVLSPGIC